MQITHRQIAALFHLYSAYLFEDLYSSLKNLWDFELLVERQMNAHHFLPTTTINTTATSQLKPLLNF